MSQEDHLIDLSEYERQDKIERSHEYLQIQSKYFKVSNIKNGSLYMAKAWIQDFDKFSRDMIIDFYREVNILSKINYPTIIKFIGYSLTNFKKKEKPVIVTEYASSTTLYELDSYDGIQFNDTQKLIIIYGIASGMSFLHSHDIIHRYLTPKSIFLDKNFYPKIAEFTYSKEISKTSQNESKLKIPIEYLAPETLTNLQYFKSSDVYSFALIVHTILKNTINYFEHENITKLLKQREEIDFSEIPIVYKILICRCLLENPDDRPTFEEIVNELRTNPEFIQQLDSVNKDEYYNYIKYIDESPISFDDNSSIEKLEEYVHKKIHTFHRNDIDIRLRGPIDSDFIINLENYQKKDLIQSVLLYDSYTVNENESNILFIAKTYNKEINTFARHEIINFCREMKIISRLNHPAILKFIGYSPIDFNNDIYPTIVTELAGNKLDDYIINDLSDTKKLSNIYGIASAMSYLHKHNIIHRDLKPENIYLDKHYFPKVTGFTISKEITENTTKSTKIKGTPIYLAPEIYLNNEYSKSSDVYSFSLVVYKIMTNEKPYSKYKSPQEIKKKVAQENERPEFTKPIPSIYRQLIERCWSKNPNDRPTFDEIINELRTNSEFITESIDKEDYFEYIKFIDEFMISFDSNKQIEMLENILSKVDTFQDIQPFADLLEMNNTETNGLTFDYNFFNLDDYPTDHDKIEGFFYEFTKIIDKKDKISYAMKKFIDVDYFFRNGIVNFRREMNIIQQLNHPSILKFIGYCPKTSKYDDDPAIITEYAENDTLKKVIYGEGENNNQIDWSDTKKLSNIYGIASAMSYLHKHNIIHRDLKPENIYLDKHYFPKVTGFTISKEITENTIKSTKIKGTPIYLAPEIYLNNEYSKSSDVYSFSLVVYEIMTGENPYSKYKSPQEIKKKVAQENERPEFTKPIPSIYRQLIERCWSKNPNDRPTFDEIINELRTNSEFITESIDKEDYFEYIKFIDESPISFDQTKKIKPIENFIPTNLFKSFSLSDNLINIRSVYKTEVENVLLNYDFINLNNYEKQKLIESNDDYKIYKIINKETGSICRAKRYNKEIHKFYNIEIVDFIGEININLEINHPSFLKFIGYSPVDFKNRSKPVIVNDYTSNGSLEQILEIDKSNNSFLNDTKKLIIIYGIAVGMQYLHSRDIIHCDLQISEVYLDDYLFPKIAGLTKPKKKSQICAFNKYEITKDGYWEPNAYYSPEVQLFNRYSQASDVYAFSMIVYELITNEKPFAEFDIFDIVEDICYKNIRPEFKNPIPDCYRKLIEKCWLPEPKDRPTFEEIVFHLKTNTEFITDKIDEEEFRNYIKFIEKSSSLSNDDNILKFDDFIKSENYTFRKINIDYKKLKELSRTKFSINMGSIDLNLFDKKQKIGSGGFGVVYKTIDKNNGSACAAKISIYEMDQCTDDIIKNLTREIEIMSHLNHPAILKYIGFSPNNFKNKPKPVIFTELAVNGSLENIIELEREGFGNHNWDDTKKLINIYGIASAMKYIHKNEILHRDLKPANILLDEYLYPKIADFGLAKNENDKSDNENKKKKRKYKGSGFVGTLVYSAPEIIKSHEYSHYSDVYAFGLIMYEIMTNEIPFQVSNCYQLLLQIKNGYRPNFKYSVPYCYKKLIEKCWDDFTFRRPSFSKIVEILETDHNFITENVNEEEYRNYISYIKENEQTILSNNNDSNNNLKSTQNYNSKIKEITNITNKIKINELENDDKNYLNSDIFLDLSKYERKELISKCDFSKIYKFKEKNTNDIYSGQMSMIKIKQLSNEDISSLSVELKNISELNHPSLLKFIGYSPIDYKNKRKPVIITEYASNGSLNDILELKRTNEIDIQGWDDTKKLINIYGIASGMSYLHSHEILHRCLKPSTIYLNDCLFPKIGDFGLSMKFYNSNSLTIQSISGLQGSPVYSAPEVLINDDYSKASDVYSFAFVVYEILTNEIPFQNINNFNSIITEIVFKENRPELNDSIPKKFRDLIEKCWNQDPKQRPTFEEISFYLKTDSEFLSDKIDKENYQKYIEYIDEQTENNKRIKIHESEDDNENSSEKDESKSFKEDQQKIINDFISSKNMKELMNFMNDNCDYEFTNDVFDKCYKESKQLYYDLCAEGISINNPVAHHKFAISLVFDDFEENENTKPKTIHIYEENENTKPKTIHIYEEAVNHLKESIEHGFNASYFLLARIYFEFYKNYKHALRYAKEGSIKNEKYSKCLFGYFVAHGIGINKDFMKGVQIILESNAEDYYQKFATDIGIYFIRLSKDKNSKEFENDAFNWFQKAFESNQSKATINNYGICFLKGIGIEKNIEKAKEILSTNKSNSLNHSDFISEEDFYLNKRQQFNVTTKNKQSNSIENYIKIAEKGNSEAQIFLFKKYSKENDSENIYKYMRMLINAGNCTVPIEYTLNLYKSMHYEQAFNYFSLISEVNHPIAQYFIGVMKFRGQGCIENRDEAYKILKNLSDNGIDRAQAFIEDYF